MKNITLISLCLLSQGFLAAAAMQVTVPVNRTEVSITLLDGVGRNLSLLTGKAYEVGSTEEVFENLPVQLASLDIAEGTFPQPADVRLQRRAASIRHKLTGLQTIALKRLDSWTDGLLQNLPQYAQADENWQQQFVGSLLQLDQILTAALNAPLQYTAEELQLRNVCQVRITQMRNALGI